MRPKLGIAALLVTIFVFGFLFGNLVHDIPYLTLDKEVNILDIFSLFVTIVIAFMIPFLVSKLIDDKRGMKVYAIDELKELVSIICEVRKVIGDAHEKGVFEAKDRDTIVYTFHKAELKATSVCAQLEEAFSKDAKPLNDVLKGCVLKYGDSITGGELMVSTFVKIDERFYKDSNTAHSEAETGLKKLVQKIYKL